MSEFNNRITAQRDALKIVNGSGLFTEALLSLTEKAIERWLKNNGIDSNNDVVKLLKSLSSTLFFLANKSQEQVTEDYKTLSEKVNKQLSDLELEMAKGCLN
jgi:hypothetical protein